MYNDMENEIVQVLSREGEFSPSRDIGEAAIAEAMKRKEAASIPRRSTFTLKVAAFASCFILLAAGGALAVSPEARDKVAGAIQSIFVLEKQGNTYVVAEKSTQELDRQQAESKIQDWSNFGGVPFSNFSEEEQVEKLGFKAVIPKEVGSHKNIDYMNMLGIRLYGKTTDLLSLNSNRVLSGINDKEAFKSLNDYNPSIYLSMSYSANGSIYDRAHYLLHAEKSTIAFANRTIETISSFRYKGIECKYVDDIRPDYQRTMKEQGNGRYITYDDPTKQPKGIAHIRHISFELDGVSYYASYLVDNSFVSFDYEAVKKFVEDYIDAYMTNK